MEEVGLAGMGMGKEMHQGTSGGKGYVHVEATEKKTFDGKAWISHNVDNTYRAPPWPT